MAGAFLAGLLGRCLLGRRLLGRRLLGRCLLGWRLRCGGLLGRRLLRCHLLRRRVGAGFGIFRYADHLSRRPGRLRRGLLGSRAGAGGDLLGLVRLLGRLSLVEQVDRAQRRDGHAGRRREPVGGNGMRDHLAEVADLSGAVVDLGVGVDDLLPGALGGQADPVVRPWLGGEVDQTGDHLALPVVADPGEHVAAGVVGVDPAESGRIVVQLEQRGMSPVGRVQVLDQPLHAPVTPVSTLIPVDAA